MLNVYVIMLVPADAPVTMPVPEPMVAWPLLLLHVPPGVMSVKDVVKPTHTLATPFIVVGIGSTVNKVST